MIERKNYHTVQLCKYAGYCIQY